LKSKGGWKKDGFSKQNKDGGLYVPGGMAYGIEHVVVNSLRRFSEKVTENDVVVMVLSFELFLSLIVIVEILL
jgi:hypothetical protein